MAVPTITKPSEIRHPNYTINTRNWRKWRLAYEGGDRFIRQYLKPYSKRESDIEFAARKEISYSPSFAKAALKEVRNSISRRLADVIRDGGSDTYREAVSGLSGGVDLFGNSMNSFISRIVLDELLPMQRIGVYVDMPQLDGTSKAAVRGKRPYLYWYRSEDIFSWDYSCDRPNEFSNLLLGDTTVEDDLTTFLPSAETRRYRHVWIDPDDGFVWVQYYGTGDDSSDIASGEPFRLNIRRIPFVIFELSDSLMADIANYQIGLLNLASSDLSYGVKSNFSLYVEQFDNRTESPNLRAQTPNQYFSETTGFDPTQNTQAVVNQENSGTVKLGTASGRRYPIGTERPAFINPSSEPMIASMKKQDQMKAEIRELVNLAVSNLAPINDNVTSADTESIESGLNAIAIELEVGERKIAEFWAMYEGSKPATITYPEHYTVISDSQRLDTADTIIEVMAKLPSKTFQKEMAKKAIRIIMQNKVPAAVLKKMFDEIDAADIITTDPDVIGTDLENGLVSLKTASKARGYPAGEVDEANNDHADRIARIAISQAKGGGMAATDTAQARGASDLGANNKAGVQEKTASLDTTQDAKPIDKQRGEGK